MAGVIMADRNLASITTPILHIRQPASITNSLKNYFKSGLMCRSIGTPCTYLTTLDSTGSTAIAVFKRSAFAGRVLTCRTLNRVASGSWADIREGWDDTNSTPDGYCLTQ